MNQKTAIAQLQCKPAEFNRATQALGIDPSDITQSEYEQIEEYLTQPKAEAVSQDRGSGRVWAEQENPAADPMAQQLAQAQGDPLLFAQLAGAAQQTAVFEAQLQGQLDVTQAANHYINMGGNLSSAMALAQLLADGGAVPDGVALPESPTLAMLALRCAIATLRQRALSAPGFFGVGSNGELLIARANTSDPYSAAVKAVRSQAPALQPTLPQAQHKALGAAQ